MLACTDFWQATIIGRTLPTSDQHFSHFYFALSLSTLHFSLAPQERKLARSVDGPIFLPDFDRSRFYLYSYVCLPPCFVLYLYIMSAWHVGVPPTCNPLWDCKWEGAKPDQYLSHTKWDCLPLGDASKSCQTKQTILLWDRKELDGIGSDWSDYLIGAQLHCRRGIAFTVLWVFSNFSTDWL